MLVLGMCFFAGGIKFSEQGFGMSEYNYAADFGLYLEIASGSWSDRPLGHISECLDRCYAAQFIAAYHLGHRCAPTGGVPLRFGWYN